MNHPNKKVAQINRTKGQRDQWQPTGPCRFHQLPQALVMDILSRLSPNTLLTCRCVCKPWLVMISDSLFNRLHHSRSPIGILIQTYPHVRSWRLRKLYFTHIVESGGADLQLERMTFRPKISIPVAADKYYWSRRCGLINSCNGLLLLAGPNNRKPLFVCNPITGEFITTPPLAAEARVNSVVVGLGFSAATNEYKVLITYLWPYPVHIYTIGTRVWREIGEPPLKDAQLQFNAFLHGALHWISDFLVNKDDFMQSFNFETEKFEIVPPPRQFAVFAPKNKLQRCSLGVLEGCLLLCGFGGYSTKFEMWIMRDYGVQESWTKTFVIESFYTRKRYPQREEYRPIMFLSNGEILMSYVYEDIGVVVCYNTETKKYRATSITLTDSAFVATGYSPSFVSLHNIAKGEEVFRIRNNENFNKLFTEGSSSAAGSGTSAVRDTNLNPDTCPPGVEEAPVTPNVTTSSASSNEQLNFTLRIGTKCAICAGQLGYVFRGKGFAMCQKCFDASSS